MDIDFHYYVTYIAARGAGFSKYGAQLMACYAEYVDETYSRSGFVEDDSIKPTRTTFDAITARHTTIPGLGGNDKETLQVWVPFHFLPGNFETKRYDFLGLFSDYELTDDDRWRLRMICDNGTELVKDMLEDCTSPAPYSDEVDPMEFRVALLGLRMHILADTFAHAGFAGFGSRKINDVTNVQKIFPNGTPIGPKDGWKGGDHAPSKFASFGHGRIGHLPDRPAVHYRWTRKWDGKVFERHNPKTYSDAFDALTFAMGTVLNAWKRIYPTQIDTLVDEPKRPPWGDNEEYFFKLGSSEVFLEEKDEFEPDRQHRFTMLRQLIKVWDAHDVGDYLGDETYRTWNNIRPDTKTFVKAFSIGATHHQKWVEGALTDYTGGLMNETALQESDDDPEPDDRRHWF